MLDIVDNPPDLTEKVCEAFRCQQFWHQGQLTDEFSVLFLKVRKGQWHRFFFDCGSLFWKTYEATDEVNTKLSDEFHYPQVDLSNRVPVVGRAITNINVKDWGDKVGLILSFEGHIEVILENNSKDESSLSIVINGHRRKA